MMFCTNCGHNLQSAGQNKERLIKLLEEGLKKNTHKAWSDLEKKTPMRL